MIVCVCKAISDRQLRASIEAGNNSFDALQFEHGVASCCGRCEDAVHDVLAGREIGCTRRMAASPASANSPVVAPVVFYASAAA
jgi:bacterioferritin-associated ferredoxin